MLLASLILASRIDTAFIDMTSELNLTLGNNAACWVDVNNDGWTDLITGGVVWLSKEGVTFKKSVSVGTVVAADFDNDGYVDLFSWSQMILFRNSEGESFMPYDLPELPATVSRGACWGDFNNDGFVDIFIGGYENWADQKTYPDMLLMNKAGESFELSWSESKYRARGVTACDFDQDGDTDVYVSNYRLMPNVLRLNDGKGVMKDVAAERNALATSAGFGGGHAIGAAWGDFNNDGRFDLFAGNFAHVDSRGDQPKSRFLQQLPDGKFEDKGESGVFYQESYASPSVADYDNDGDLDLYFTTVYATASFGRKNYPVLFRNEGEFSFGDATALAGLAQQPATYQSAWADFDRDGDLDLVTGGRLFVNQEGGNSWLEVRLVGDGKTVNRSAIGAQVRISTDGKTMTRQVEAGTGEGNQNALTLHFGLGTNEDPVDLQIFWPGGHNQTVKDVKVGQIIEVKLSID